MKQLFEIAQTLNLLRGSRRGNVFAPVEIQALEWALRIMLSDPLHAEDKIIERLWKLADKQASKEIMGFATKAARAKQINALKWVINEVKVDHFEPLY